MDQVRAPAALMSMASSSPLASTRKIALHGWGVARLEVERPQPIERHPHRKLICSPSPASPPQPTIRQENQYSGAKSSKSIPSRGKRRALEEVMTQEGFPFTSHGSHRFCLPVVSIFCEGNGQEVEALGDGDATAMATATATAAEARGDADDDGNGARRRWQREGKAQAAAREGESETREDGMRAAEARVGGGRPPSPKSVM
ncbi:hypothetical protein OsJ_23918 [Oryza sativa Japonica Group]|uniref:Uncharacterized protein n=1 Tax=Oryza sativa subsp. japonica TaxID=39947 RepID=Q7EYK5_ORYSJ|nr:hypothetical protein OsJ_23918 [Oryza sativa Japonica Group]BAC84356.1 hypothetical protein [Oryza sativa Japonica Group]